MRSGPNPAELLSRSGLAQKTVTAWLKAQPQLSKNFPRDAASCGKFWRLGADLAAKLPKKSKRTAEQQAAAEFIGRLSRGLREEFLLRHVDAIYRKLTNNRTKFVRAEELVYDAAKLVPGLTPTRKELAAEDGLMQSEKDGVEIDQGIFLSNVLGHPESGMHLCHAMLRPVPTALEKLEAYLKAGVLDLGTAKVERMGKASVVTMQNPRYLNAEDETTIGPTETAVDLAMLDPLTEVGVLRGGPVDHPKYNGRRTFSTGINLTHLYRGKISFLWYMRRDMGFINKIFRGIAGDADPDELRGGTQEKCWIAGLDAYAIGGGCQYLLAMDYIVAASDAYMTLPARKEGIIPGVANLRMPRFTGDRIARQAILMDKRIDCDSPEGRMICDAIVPPGEVDAGIKRAVAGFAGSGVVSAAGNRRALRVSEEPLDLFRRYMAVYAREQAYCHFSPALIANLEKFWNAAQRKL
ncbi:MAG TPA: enoyl-CoA hydratase/isomerase family protein [Pseudolabrys sp.]|nr:enoyl-CoA hydratase/isomerase family protein [Pseudolabrys sp.]